MPPVPLTVERASARRCGRRGVRMASSLRRCAAAGSIITGSKQRGQAPADGGGGRGCQAPSGVGGLGSRPPPLCFFPEPRVFLRAITRVITPSAKVGLPRTAVGPATKGGLTPTKSHGRVRERWARWISGVAAGVSSVPCCRCATRFRGLPFIGEAYFRFSSGPLTGDISWPTGRFHPALPPGSASSR